MYVPEAFREERPEVLRAFMRAHSFATLVSPGEQGLIASHLPLLLDAERGPHGTLLGHLARANDHWRALEGGETLVIFQGPHAYVTPRWYSTPIAVPTWNYTAVHAYGRATLVQDGPALRAILDRTVAAYEAASPDRWQPPAGDVVPTLMRQVVGFEIPIARLQGKLKLSQNRSRADREGVVQGLRRQDDPIGHAVAELMAERL